MKKWSQKLGSKLKRDKLKKEESHLVEIGSNRCVPDESNQSSDTLKPSATDVTGSSATLDSALQAARQALVHTRTVTGKHLEHENKPGYYGEVALSVVNRLSVFTNSVKKFADGVDQSILDLFETLDSVYEFIEDTTEVKTHPSYERIITSLAQQTVECAYFIRDYANKKNFWIRAGRNAIGEPIKSRVQSYQGAFKNLLEEFQTRSALHTEITVSRLLELNQSTSENLDLDNLPYASGAGLSSRKQCLPGTRVEILKEITEWINDPDENCPKLFWLAGPAGVGKSAIAHSVALTFKSLRRLGSFFCFDRNQSIDGRRDKIFSTIARDIVDLDSQIKHELVKTIKSETSLRKTPDLQLEWEKFILEPLRITSKVSTGPILVVIDALDESGDPSLRKELVKILQKGASALPANIRFLVTSRPEKDITLAFSKSHIRTKMMNTIPESETNRDILSYFETTLEAEIADGFFTDGHLRRLVDLSQGLFQWAFLASEFIIGLGNSAGSIATERYETLINAQHIRSINDPLDVMYNQILSSLFDSDNLQVMTRFRSVIGSIVTASEPLSLKTLVALRGETIPMSRKQTDIKVVIQYMGSLLSGTDDPLSTIRPLHLSFREFLLDESRSGKFWIDPSRHHRDFAFGCLRTMSEELRFNICDIPNSHIHNVDDEGLPERISSSISSQLSYSSRFWVLHVSSTTFDSLLAEKIDKFLRDYFLLWLEVLSLLKAIGGVAKYMSNLISWCSGKECHETLYDFAVDGKRFIQLFGHAIGESTPHIYLSALPFCPQDSVIYKTFIGRFRNILRIASEPLHGWPLGRRRIDGMMDIECACFSHGGQYLAVGMQGGIIEILDSESLEIKWVIESPHKDSIRTVQFSIGDKSLVFAITTGVYSFDILTHVMTLQVNFPPWHLIKLSHDAKFVVLDHHNSWIFVQNLETKEEIINVDMKWTPGADYDYEFSNPDNDTFVYLGEHVGVQLWSLETGAVLRRLQPPSPDFFHQWDGPDDATRVLTPLKVYLNKDKIIFNRYGSLYIWNLQDELVTTLQGYGLIEAFTMTPDGNCISIQVSDNLILHDMNDDVELCCETIGTTAIIYKSVFSKDGKWLVAFSSNRLDVLDLDGWRSFAHIHDSRSSPHYGSPIVSSNLKYFLVGISGLEDIYYEIWDFELGKPIQTLGQGATSSHVNYKLAMSGIFSATSRYFGYVFDKQSVKIYDIYSETIKDISFHDQEADVASIAFSQDETLLAILDISQGTIYIWNIDSSLIIDTLSVPKFTRELGLHITFKASPTFRYFAYTDTYGELILLNRTRLIPLDSAPWDYSMQDFMFNLDEERMRISFDSKIFHINLITGECQAVTLQGIPPLNPFDLISRNKPKYFIINSEPWLFEGAMYETDTGWRWYIWNSSTGRLLYSALMEHPEESIRCYSPVHQGLFTSSSSYRRVLALNTEEDDQICFSSNKQHSLRTLPRGYSARLRPDGWVVTQNDELLFWVPQEYHQILHLPRLKYIVGRKSIELD